MRRKQYGSVDTLVRHALPNLYTEYRRLKGETVDLLTEGPLINWTLGRAAKNLRIKRNLLDALIHDGRFANALVTAWFASHGYRQVTDMKGGVLLTRAKRFYRVRVGTDNISFGYSASKGVGRTWNPRKQKQEMKANRGFIVVFTEDMPIADTYLISTDYLFILQNSGLLNKRWEGPSGPIRRQMRETAIGLRER